jgi:hypothetical protein
MMNVVFWDVALCSFGVNRLFGGTYRLHLQGRKIRERRTRVIRWLQLSYQSEITSYIGSEQSETECRPHGKPTVEWGGSVLGLC